MDFVTETCPNEQADPHIYIYISIYLCGGVIYLVQVWSFEGLLSGPSLFLFNTACQKHYKIGFQHIFVEKKIARKSYRGYCLVQVGHF